jgi:hypothetical protein
VDFAKEIDIMAQRLRPGGGRRTKDGQQTQP